jgi:hypothetical protein
VSAEQKLNQLVQDKVDGKVLTEKDTDLEVDHNYGNNTDEIGERQTEINITSMKVYNGQEDKRHAKAQVS